MVASAEDFVTGYLVISIFVFFVSFCAFSVLFCVICLGYSIHNWFEDNPSDDEEIPFDV